MLVNWKIQYLDRASRKLNVRCLYVETDDLKPSDKAAVEYLIEASAHRTSRDILRFRSLFIEKDEVEYAAISLKATNFNWVSLGEYYEDEEGTEVSLNEVIRILTGSPTAVVIPHGLKQHDIDYMFAAKTPIPVKEVTLSTDDVRLLAYFCRDFAELRDSAFVKDGPGTLSHHGESEPLLETAVSDDEIRSFVTIFRRLYMANEKANFNKAVDVFVKALDGHPYAKWADGDRIDFNNQLESVVDHLPFAQSGKYGFNGKRLVDVFLYTKYSHQPCARRERQYEACLAEVGEKKGLLAWMFLVEIWQLTIHIRNAGKRINWWFDEYCQEHQLAADVVDSILKENPKIGSYEKKAERQQRVFRQKAEELAAAIWKENGSPAGGHAQFLDEARKQLQSAVSHSSP